MSKVEIKEYPPQILEKTNERIDYEITLNYMTVVEFIDDLIVIVQSKFMIMHEHGFITKEFGGFSLIGTT